MGWGLMRVAGMGHGVRMAPHTQLHKVTGCGGTCSRPRPLQPVPPMASMWGGPAVGHTVRSPCSIPEVSPSCCLGHCLAPSLGSHLPFRAFPPHLHS